MNKRRVSKIVALLTALATGVFSGALAQMDDEEVSDESYALYDAVSDGNIQALAQALDDGADPNANFYGAYLLDIALSKENPKIIELLLQAGADPNLLSISGDRTIFAWHAIRPPDFTFAQIILTHTSEGISGANDTPYGPPPTVFIRNKRPDLLKLYLEKAEDLDLTLKDKLRGETALIAAAAMSDKKSIDILISAVSDLDPNARDAFFEWNALDYAISERNTEIAGALLQAFDGWDLNVRPNPDTSFGISSAFERALLTGDINLIETILEFGAKIDFNQKNWLTGRSILELVNDPEILELVARYAGTAQ